jgi:hypothetical protein
MGDPGRVGGLGQDDVGSVDLVQRRTVGDVEALEDVERRPVAVRGVAEENFP